MDEWHVGDPEDWGDHVGVPDIAYMGYLQDDEENNEYEVPPHISKSNKLRDEAWKLRENGRYNDALIKINEALEYSSDWRSYNIKAIIIEDMNNYNGALYYYDQALKLYNSQVVKDNKARLLERMAEKCISTNDYPKALEHINQALKLTDNENNRNGFLRTKSDILQLMDRPREAYICNKLANKQFNHVDEFEKQSKILKDTADTLICISGRKFYGNCAPTVEGSIVKLIKEPENEHDSDAIRVEFNQKTAGYVANSPHTKISEAKSASEIKNMFENCTKARILFVFMEDYLVAKLI